ncbi:hypothetical protein QZQ41_09065 [Serratia marcescens]|uniref:hypothetical protein n=1 Tax=Serratia marcescens TaxID=615 RepID=UPI0013A58208|nr:hypothetical protein [Serratia marcescens]MDP8609670.1 hypothetical protein [Serratia marcescens]MDP8614760.1 hypothetical protein [Serratia marcescens]MDP8644819.1 hypothetical protein [Serratia marcescens]MDP8654752.1 hypothetical protein [Serratia marcescens]MDP8659715.1 hypothetical protein [Serratia marcescens]
MNFQTEMELVVTTIISGVVVYESSEKKLVDINILSVNALSGSDASVSYTKILGGKVIGLGEKVFKYDLLSDLFSQASQYLRSISSREL